MKNKENKKTTTDLSAKHFSRYGEFLVSFELSKYGWNVYNPVYDEYIDLIIHKHVCKDCGRKWNLTPALVCKKCGKDFSKRQKSKIIAKKNYTTKFRSVQVKSSRIESKGPRQATFQCEGLWEVERVFKLE